jgi:hypothetical protein
MVLVLVASLSAGGQACISSSAFGRDVLHLNSLNLNLHDVFGTSGDHPGDVLFHTTPVEPATNLQGVISPSLNFGQFRASIRNSTDQFDGKGLDTTSVHGYVGGRTTKVLFTFPIH